MKLALLKKPLHPDAKHFLAHHVGARIDHGIYSHSNLIFSDNLSGSSWADGGVQIKRVDYDPDLWDFWDLPHRLEMYARSIFEKYLLAPYDYLGTMRFAVSIFKDSAKRFFCHEIIGLALKAMESWRLGPNLLLLYCKQVLNAWKTDVWLHQPPPPYLPHPAIVAAGARP